MIDDLADLGGLDDLPDISDLLDAGDDAGLLDHVDGADLPGGLDIPDPFGEPTLAEDVGGFDWLGGYEPYVPDWDAERFDGFGDPSGYADFWFLQEWPTSCAVATQTMVLESVTGMGLDEATLADFAASMGWFDPEIGTYPMDAGRLLEHHGLETDIYFSADITEIAEALERGDHVLVGVNAQEIWAPLRDSEGNAVQQASEMHSVWVTGLDQSPDGTIHVIVNDPGTPEGQMMPVALEDFVNAWEDTGNHAVIARQAAGGLA